MKSKKIEISESLLKGFVSHAKKVADGFGKPYDYRVAEALRLMKKEAERIDKLLTEKSK